MTRGLMWKAQKGESLRRLGAILAIAALPATSLAKETADFVATEAGAYAFFVVVVGWLPPYIEGEFDFAQATVGP